MSDKTTSTTASELLEKLLQTHSIKDVNKEGLNEEEQATLEKLKRDMEKFIEDNKNDLASVKSKLREFIDNNENIEVTEQEYNEFLTELSISLKGEGKEEEAEEEEEEEAIAQQAVEEVTATVNAQDIEKGLQDMKYKNVKVEIEDNKIKVEATPIARGGKSKKKQMKPKNKSNKKMKKKQTKKGGKQIKKRSLKRKMKK